MENIKFISEKEMWKPVVDNEERYEVSNWGRIRNIKTQYILKQFPNIKGYLQVRIMFNGGEETRRMHRLVAESWLPNPNNYPQINHIDNNKLNNHISNLEWCNNTQNAMHYKKNGKWNSRLSNTEIREMFYKYKRGTMQKDLALEYGVSRGTVSLLCNSKTWSHVTNRIEL